MVRVAVVQGMSGVREGWSTRTRPRSTIHNRPTRARRSDPAAAQTPASPSPRVRAKPPAAARRHGARGREGTGSCFAETGACPHLHPVLHPHATCQSQRQLPARNPLHPAHESFISRAMLAEVRLAAQSPFSDSLSSAEALPSNDQPPDPKNYFRKWSGSAARGMMPNASTPRRSREWRSVSGIAGRVFGRGGAALRP